MTAVGSLRVRVLGPASIDGADPLAPRDRQVLAALVVEAGRVCPADRLAEALYGSSPPATWRKVVHGSIARLRHHLGGHAIVTTGAGYRLELGDDEIDVRRFERLIGEAERLSVAGEHERTALALRAAIELVVGEPWVDLEAGSRRWQRRPATGSWLARRRNSWCAPSWPAVGTGWRWPWQRSRWCAAVEGATLGGVGPGAVSGGTPGGGVADDPPRPASAGGGVGVGAGPGAGRVGAGDPRS